jgi:uncharacterized protein (UPF0332 family)
MKTELDEFSKKALVKYRIDRAYDTLKEAEVMRRESFFNASVNRMYYACYYAVVALLLQHNIPSQTHSGVRAMLGLHFVSKGLLSVQEGKVFSTLFEKRHSGDYDDFVYCDADMVDELLPQAESFVDSVANLLKSPKESATD